ncbi:UDP-N-acetylglucosamine--N-acetylmuramyl-(pentapeptide) pyrophosphoryl-undecaprenol N-acetylglucosamine transferase [bacterium HR40]|nr:UDP-N-acetylglucosamine--N-acetylmuramyl-(pentapeptide) pyrophosphoryl-undecaprenol N-acetylglucosamine transferase [bacterium HR40]
MARIVIWVQSLLGIGHLRRMLLFAGTLARRGHRVVVANGGPPSPWPAADGVRIVQLEPLRAADSTFSLLLDGGHRPPSEALWSARLAQLRRLSRSFAPEALVIEHFPFGRHAFARELLPWLSTVRRQRPAIPFIASVRDVLVRKKDLSRYEEMARLVRRWFDLVIVHADPSFVPFGASFPALGAIQDRLRYAGYLVEPRLLDLTPAPERRGVVISAGGGAVGARLFETALAARRLSRLAAEPWTFVAGSQPSTVPFARLAPPPSRVHGEVILLSHDPDLPLRIAKARVSVSQAGYNTVVETLMAGTPMLLVPFARDDETEQTERACCLAERGFASWLAEDALTPPSLAAAIDATATRPSPPLHLAVDAGERAAMLVEAALGRRER